MEIKHVIQLIVFNQISVKVVNNKLPSAFHKPGRNITDTICDLEPLYTKSFLVGQYEHIDLPNQDHWLVTVMGVQVAEVSEAESITRQEFNAEYCKMHGMHTAFVDWCELCLEAGLKRLWERSHVDD